MSSSLRQPATPPAYAPPRIPIRRIPVTGAPPPLAWWFFAAGLLSGWLLHALTN